MANLIRIWNYGNYSSSNYGSTRAVQIGSLILYFSYRTVIAFEDGHNPITISENCYSVTTGKHLNWIDEDKKKRIPKEQFEKELEIVLKRHGLKV